MFRLTLTVALQDIGKADNIAIDIGLRIFDRITNASLYGQVYNLVQIVLLKGLIQTLTIMNIHWII